MTRPVTANDMQKELEIHCPAVNREYFTLPEEQKRGSGAWLMMAALGTGLACPPPRSPSVVYTPWLKSISCSVPILSIHTAFACPIRHADHLHNDSAASNVAHLHPQVVDHKISTRKAPARRCATASPSRPSTISKREATCLHLASVAESHTGTTGCPGDRGEIAHDPVRSGEREIPNSRICSIQREPILTRSSKKIRPGRIAG